MLPSGSGKLTKREHDIVALGSLGLTDKQIAETLNVGKETVVTHWRRLRRKLRVENRTQAVAAVLQRDASELLRLKDERLQIILGGAPIVLYAVDRTGILTLAEGRVLDFVGVAADQVVGRRVEELAAEFCPDPQQALTFFQAWLSGDASPGVVRVLDRYLEIHRTIVRDESGEIAGLIGVGTDVTARELAFQALQKSEKLYRQLVEWCPDAIFLNQDERIVYANQRAAALLGCAAPEELTGRSMWEFVHPKSRGDVERRIRMLDEEVSELSAACQTLLRADGGSVLVEVAASRCTWEGMPAALVVARQLADSGKSSL